jgi:adenylosuccinate synthase
MDWELRERLIASGWFVKPGAHVLVDGQYGSTGKGLIASVMAQSFYDKVEAVVSNAGPNSGHTSYWHDEKIVLKQLPTFSVMAKIITKRQPVTLLSAGAVVHPELLAKECNKYGITAIVHPHAAVVEPRMVEKDAVNVSSIASTGQGVGPAQIRKLQRVPAGTWLRNPGPFHPDLSQRICFFEIPQGFSLGINSGFYPHVTTRECSVSQALSDACVPPSFHRKTIMTCRTYPIRVGNTENSSGPNYVDQEEIDWKDIDRPPELTTVTGRVRRLFTWSESQFVDSLLVLDPDVIALTFCDYLRDLDAVNLFVHQKIVAPYRRILNRSPDAILLSYGPRNYQVKLYGGPT